MLLVVDKSSDQRTEKFPLVFRDSEASPRKPITAATVFESAVKPLFVVFFLSFAASTNPLAT